MEEKIDPTAKPGILSKLRSVRHIKVVAVAAIALIVLVALIAYIGGGEDTTTEQTLDERLAEILSQIEGVGECKVMITYDGEGEHEIAYEQESESNITTDSDGSGDRVVENSNSHSRPVTVIVDGVEQPLIVSTTPAPVKGVVVVAQGGDDIYTKLRIIDAVCALVEVNGLNVKVFGME